MYSAPPLINSGLPAVVLVLTSTGRLVVALGIALVGLGLAELALTARSRRQLPRTFE